LLWIEERGASCSRGTWIDFLEAVMKTTRLAWIPLALAAVLLTPLAVLAENPGEGGRPLTVTLTGEAEVPGPGAADGAGTATLRLNPGQEEICYELSVSGIGEATAAHIHQGAAGEAGPPVVTLEAPVDGSSSGCAPVERALVRTMIQNPEGFYVNVHNEEFPDGAVRGQLGK
jgi:hypothetical protein